jgi:hypothetical protein
MPRQTDGPPAPDAAATQWRIDAVVAGKRMTAVRDEATLDSHFLRAATTFIYLRTP